jgi:hypothetical protein
MGWVLRDGRDGDMMAHSGDGENVGGVGWVDVGAALAG